MKKKVSKLLQKAGYKITKIHTENPTPQDIVIEKEFLSIFENCKSYTMTGIERMFALYNSVKYVIENDVPGDFVECGTWKGGSSMLMTMTLKHFGVTDRKIYLYDTFEGMSDPTDDDKSIRGGSAHELLSEQKKEDDRSVWCFSSIDEVKANMRKTGYPEENIVFIEGKVEDTIPKAVPEKISLLRLDTDWYESTRHELVHLYPILVEKGILIIDDYGHWEGCRKAVDEYFKDAKYKPILNRIDYTGRLVVKQAD